MLISHQLKQQNHCVSIKLLLRNGLLSIAEAAQMLTRNVNYEVPGLKKVVSRCKKSQSDCTRKETEHNALAAELRTKYTDMCTKIGIEVSVST